jgi:hypothetical protein
MIVFDRYISILSSFFLYYISDSEKFHSTVILVTCLSAATVEYQSAIERDNRLFFVSLGRIE